jgi:branched-chain amino acid transport system permease protein
MSQATTNIIILILIFGIVTLGLDLVVGYAKVFSVTQALLFGVGAFSYAGSVNLLHTDDFFAAVGIAAVVAIALSGAIALASLRVSSDYFVVTSLSAQIIGVQVIYNWSALSAGATGIFGLPYPSVAGWVPVSINQYLWLTLIVFALVYALVAILLLSPYGRVVRALGANESALSAAGFNVRRLKVTMFVLCGLLAVIGGVLYGGYNGVAQTGDYSIDLSMTMLAMVIIGGTGRMIGAVIGAALLELVPYVLNNVGISSAISGPLNQAIFGAMLVLVVMFMPSGITGVTAQGINLLRQRVGRSAAAVGVTGADSSGASGAGAPGAPAVVRAVPAVTGRSDVDRGADHDD